MVHRFFVEGVKIAHEAVTLDSEGKHDDALKRYTRAVEFMVAGMKYEKNPKTRATMRQQCQSVLRRAEEIKALQSNLSDKRKEDKKKKKKDGRKEADQEDVSSLRAQLEDVIVREKPDVSWDDVVGMEDAKAAMQEAIVLPTKYPQLFTGKRKPPSGILLFGPPGTGKTYLAKACASMSDATFFSVSSSSIMSKYQGESERLVRELFRMAKENRPSIVFIDEIDALGTRRSDDDTDSVKRIKNELLIQIQKADDEGGIMVLGATNTPSALDPALRRRFHRRIYIPLPDVRAREAIIAAHMGKDTDTEVSREDIRRFAEQTEGHSASDLAIMVRDALMAPVRRALHATHFKQDNDGYIVPCSASDPGTLRMTLWDIEKPELLRIEPVRLEDFERSVQRTRPSVSAKDIEEHLKFANDYGEGHMVTQHMQRRQHEARNRTNAAAYGQGSGGERSSGRSMREEDEGQGDDGSKKKRRSGGRRAAAAAM